MNLDGNRCRTSSRKAASAPSNDEKNLAWKWWSHYLQPAGWIQFIPQESQFAEDFGFIPVQYMKDYYQKHKEGDDKTTSDGKPNARDVSKFVMKHGKRREHYAIGWHDLYFMVTEYGSFDDGRPPMLLDYKGPSLWQGESTAACQAESAAPKLSCLHYLYGGNDGKAKKPLESRDADKNSVPKKKVTSKKARKRKKKRRQRQRDKKQGERDDTTKAKAPQQPFAHILFAPKYSVGTKVRKQFENFGWYNGEIVSICENNRTYKVRYDDNDVEDYYFETPEIQEIVENGKNKRNLELRQNLQPPLPHRHYQQQQSQTVEQHQSIEEEEEGEIQEQQQLQTVEQHQSNEEEKEEEEEGELQEQQHEAALEEGQLIDDDDESSFDEEALQAKANAALMVGAKEHFLFGDELDDADPIVQVEPTLTSTTASSEAQTGGSSGNSAANATFNSNHSNFPKRKESPVNPDTDTEVMQPRRKKMPLSKSGSYVLPPDKNDVCHVKQHNKNSGKVTPTPIDKLTVEFSSRELGLLCKDLQAIVGKEDPKEQVDQQLQSENKSSAKQPDEHANQPEEEAMADVPNPCHQNPYGRNYIPPPPHPRRSIPQPPPPPPPPLPQYYYSNDQYYYSQYHHQYQQHQFPQPPPPPPPPPPPLPPQPYYNPYGNQFYGSQPQLYYDGHSYAPHPNQQVNH